MLRRFDLGSAYGNSTDVPRFLTKPCSLLVYGLLTSSEDFLAPKNLAVIALGLIFSKV
jgi:hypothetical protein